MNLRLQTGLLCLIGLTVAYGVARGVTPKLIEAARKFGILDRPTVPLKTQKEPVPYLGGLAVGLAVLAALALTYRFDQQLLGILLGAAIVLVVGLVDDLGGLSPPVKLAGQFLGVLVLLKSGIWIKLVFLPLWVVFPLTVLWMLAATNAFNLIDVMDGLSSGVGAVAALYFAGIALAGAFTNTALLGAALAGGLLGFRHFNVEPARIYLGDTGSLFTGFILGALAVTGQYTFEHSLGAIVPLLILGVPLFDMLFVMYIRWRRGMPVMLGSPDHVALRLRRWKLSTRSTVRASLGASGVIGGSGIAVMLLPLPWAAGLLAFMVVMLLALGLWLKTIDVGL